MRAEQFFFGNPFESEFDLPPGFMGGVAVQEQEQEEKQEQQQEETTPPFTLPSDGDSNLDILGDVLAGSGLLSTIGEPKSPCFPTSGSIGISPRKFFLNSSATS